MCFTLVFYKRKASGENKRAITKIAVLRIDSDDKEKEAYLAVWWLVEVLPVSEVILGQYSVDFA